MAVAAGRMTTQQSLVWTQLSLKAALKTTSPQGVDSWQLYLALCHLTNAVEDQEAELMALREMKPSLAATEPTEDEPSGSSTSSLTWHLVREVMPGVWAITATVTSHGFSSRLTRGGVRKLWQDDSLNLVTPDQWALLRPSGRTPSTTQEVDQGGRPAGIGGVSLDSWADRVRSTYEGQPPAPEPYATVSDRRGTIWGPVDQWGNRYGFSSGLDDLPVPEPTPGREEGPGVAAHECTHEWIVPEGWKDGSRSRLNAPGNWIENSRATCRDCGVSLQLVWSP